MDESALTATSSFGDYLPPLAIVRLRPDHLLTVSWNLTRAAMEFSGRAAAAASGGNFVALWGPTSHSETCGPMICPNTKTTPPKSKISSAREREIGTPPQDWSSVSSPSPPEAAGAHRKCYINGRLDDGFAFGTPHAMDGYAAPYHPYQSKCCEEYLTSTLPLAGLTQVRALVRVQCCAVLSLFSRKDKFSRSTPCSCLRHSFEHHLFHSAMVSFLNFQNDTQNNLIVTLLDIGVFILKKIVWGLCFLSS